MLSKRQFIKAAIFLWLSSCIFACNPGPRFGYRHPLRPLSPLLRGQFIPSISEKTIGASGPIEGRITRNSPEFSNLLHNYNPSIIFSDEERDGTDRIMTQRCKDKVDTLAILVANQWPGVRLRIIDAWEPEEHHGTDSLRYEGRAVDFTTSDRDLSKYGMLARLAVEAGFDWVYYSSRFRVYASVRSDDSVAAKLGGCFPADSSVILENNKTLRMSEVQLGNRVLAFDRLTGQLIYSDVIMMLDRQLETDGQFIEISTATNILTLTPNHQLFVSKKNKTFHEDSTEEVRTWLRLAEPTFAEDVSAGQYVFITNEVGQKALSVPSKVFSIRKVVRHGLVAPLTRHGTILVNGVAASCYSVFKYEPLAHAAFLPARTFNFFQSNDSNISGIHWYARTLSRVATSIFPNSFFRLIA